MLEKVKKHLKSIKSWVILFAGVTFVELMLEMHRERDLPDFTIGTYALYLELVIWVATLLIMSHKRCK